MDGTAGPDTHGVLCKCPLLSTLLCGRRATEGGGPTELREFLSTYRCAVAERLAIIHANRDRDLDRFLIIALKFIPENYVQCLFLDGDRRMLCEASSGFHAQLPGESQLQGATPGGLAALARLGFSTDGSEGNFQRIIEFSGEPDLESVDTRFMGYG
jgi:hypothetical protein